MLHYLIEHKLLPDVCINSMKGMERGKQLVQENMDFIARFMRGNDIRHHACFVNSLNFILMIADTLYFLLTINRCRQHIRS